MSRQISELHLDERFNSAQEVLGKHLAQGQKKVSSAFNQLWADVEVMREAQRRKSPLEQQQSQSQSQSQLSRSWSGGSVVPNGGEKGMYLYPYHIP